MHSLTVDLLADTLEGSIEEQRALTGIHSVEEAADEATSENEGTTQSH